VSPRTPPVLASQILAGLVAEAGYRDAILGDLEEEFAKLVSRSGVSFARRWYWSQTLRAIGPLTWSQSHDFGVSIRIAATAVATYLMSLEGIRAESALVRMVIPFGTTTLNRIVMLACVALAGLLAGWTIVKALPQRPVIGAIGILSLVLAVGTHHVVVGSSAETVFRSMKVLTLGLAMCSGSLLTLWRNPALF